MIGILIAYLVVSAQREPSRLLVMFIALMCFEVFFLAVVDWLARPCRANWRGGASSGNALAARGMLVYFFAGHRALGRALLGPWTRVAREGALAGLAGAAAVAHGSSSTIWPRACHSAPRPSSARHSSRGCATPALVITVPGHLKYTVVHGLAFVAFGWLAAGLLALVDREPQLIVAVSCCSLLRGVLLRAHRDPRRMAVRDADLVDDRRRQRAGGRGDAGLSPPRAPDRLATASIGPSSEADSGVGSAAPARLDRLTRASPRGAPRLAARRPPLGRPADSGLASRGASPDGSAAPARLDRLTRASPRGAPRLAARRPPLGSNYPIGALPGRLL